MAFFSSGENRVKCGKCGTEFDLNKNKDVCPLCGFGGKLSGSEVAQISQSKQTEKENKTINYLKIPSQIKVRAGKVIVDDESSRVGLWGMFNDFFSGKAMLRICANMMEESKIEGVTLNKLIEKAKGVMQENHLTVLKGFPNDIESDSSVGRLVFHFLAGFNKMGLVNAKLVGTSEREVIWSEPWESIIIAPTQKGLEFARLRNRVFDEHDYKNQVLTEEEQKWMINYLAEIDKQGFKEYHLLKQITSFIKKGKNGNKDLWGWFKENPEFITYIKNWSSKNDNPKAFEKQITNLAQTFGSGKISLLREMGIIQNKRNDYTIIGDF